LLTPNDAPMKARLLADLQAEGLHDRRVIGALEKVPRERFVPEELRSRAYENVALPIGDDQTISQPTVVAHMVQAARPKPGDHVLEIGTGSGYCAAVLSELARDVVTVEIRPDLAMSASQRLSELGCRNVHVIIADGSLGWSALAPYDVIITTAAAPGLPPVLLEQLSMNGGRLVAPVGTLKRQQLVYARRSGDDITSHALGSVRFVPLVGAAGFHVADSRKN
jgi:protein-L-isoaspartate(D-aspartate) O-methyltransferase